MSKFDENIKKFNEMYKLPVAETPTVEAINKSVSDQLFNFQSILGEELTEILDIIELAQQPDCDTIEVLTKLADLLGDIQVYCASEMRKFGLDNEGTLNIIMASNMSKMGPDGKPIYDERGKLQKGPNYWKPEPLIAALIKHQMGVKDE